MQVFCPYCDAEIEVDDGGLENYANDWMEDVECEHCGRIMDLFIEFTPEATAYEQKFTRCAECGKRVKSIHMWRNPYSTENKKYCRECYQKNIQGWISAAREAQEKANVKTRGRPKKASGGNSDAK